MLKSYADSATSSADFATKKGVGNRVRVRTSIRVKIPVGVRVRVKVPVGVSLAIWGEGGG